LVYLKKQKIKNNNNSPNSSLIHMVWLSWDSDYKVCLKQKELFYYRESTKAIFKTFRVSIFVKFRFRGSFCCINKKTCRSPYGKVVEHDSKKNIALAKGQFWRIKCSFTYLLNSKNFEWFWKTA
jgi:hypothetical protein